MQVPPPQCLVPRHPPEMSAPSPQGGLSPYGVSFKGFGHRTLGRTLIDSPHMVNRQVPPEDQMQSLVNLIGPLLVNIPGVRAWLELPAVLLHVLPVQLCIAAWLPGAWEGERGVRKPCSSQPLPCGWPRIEPARGGTGLGDKGGG